MKYKIKKIISFLFFLVFSCTLISCANEENPKDEKMLNSIELITKNVTRKFYIGSDFSSENLVVNAIYSDGTSQDITVLAVIDSSNYSKNEIGTYEIVVSYTENERIKKSKYEVEVISIMDDYTNKYIVGLDIKLDKTNYTIGQQIDLSTLCVTAVYSDFTTEILSDNKFTVDVSSVDVNKAGVYPIYVSNSNTYTLGEYSETIEIINFIQVYYAN